MYLDCFGFDEPPFSITPDPKFVFLSEKHKESLAHLVYGITRGGGAGFVQLTGEVGTGKTTISRLFLEQISDNTKIALILNPTITPLELIQNICKELKISMRGIKTKLNTLIDKLNNFLLESWANGENTVVIIDEAQNIPRDTLEQLRLLTNLETDTHKLLQIVLIGQPELRETMRRNDLRQLAQRVTARYHLMPLSIDETYQYLQHRIGIAGVDKSLFNYSLAKKIHKLTTGIPRLINTLADRSLLAAYTDNKLLVSSKHITTAAKEVLPEQSKSTNFLNLKFITITLLLLTIAILSTTNWKSYQGYFTSQETPDIIVKQLSFKPETTKEAWQYYFKLWDTKSNKNWHKPQCPDTKDIGMACLRRQGNINQLTKINRPVILQLEDSSLVLLAAISENKMGLLNSSNEIQYINKGLLDKQWLGTYFIIWPMPAEILIEPNTEQLQNWALEMANTISSKNIITVQLEKWIKNFQNKHGLQADGIIGTETQMRLSLIAYNGPTLKK